MLENPLYSIILTAIHELQTENKTCIRSRMLISPIKAVGKHFTAEIGTPGIK
jgi:hypothetical protein